MKTRSRTSTSIAELLPTDKRTKYFLKRCLFVRGILKKLIETFICNKSRENQPAPPQTNVSDRCTDEQTDVHRYFWNCRIIQSIISSCSNFSRIILVLYNKCFCFFSRFYQRYNHFHDLSWYCDKE